MPSGAVHEQIGMVTLAAGGAFLLLAPVLNEVGISPASRGASTNCPLQSCYCNFAFITVSRVNKQLAKPSA